MKRKNLLLGAAAALLVLCSVPALPALDTGTKAPDFTLTDVTGKPVTLSSFAGKHVVLEWTNYDCPFVKKHYESGNMQALQKTYTEKGVIWLSICSSAQGKEGYYPADKWPAMIQARKAVPTAVLLDADGKVGKLYGAKTTPHIFIIGPAGMLIYQGAIDNKPSFDKADIQGATNYVSKVLEPAMNGKDVTQESTQSYGCSVKY